MPRTATAPKARKGSLDKARGVVKGEAGKPKPKKDGRWVTVRGRAIFIGKGEKINFGKPDKESRVQAARDRIEQRGGKPKPSAKEQAAAHRAKKGSRAERLAKLDSKADRIYSKRKDGPKDSKTRNSAYDRSVAISRTKYREDQGKKAGAKGRGTVDRAKQAETIKKAREIKEKSKKAAEKDPTSHTDHKPGHVGDVPRDQIKFDPQRFQYKQDVTNGATGSVGSLAGVKKWDPELAGVVQVWKDPANGQTYVVNGHNRLDLAGKIGVDKVTVRYLEAKDAKEARGKGALTNIAEGRGTAMDAAKFFKDTGIRKADLEARGIPMREKMADDGLALSNLEPRLFRRVIDGEFTVERGAIIGRAGLNETQQNALVDLVERQPKGRPITNDVLKELTDTVKSSGSKASGGFDLFGDTGEQSLALGKASLQASIKSRLASEKKLFGLVSKSKAAAKLERGDNKINTEKSGAIARDATEALGVFDQLKNLSGPISSRLNKAAERIANGEARKKVEDETYREILENLREAYKL